MKKFIALAAVLALSFAACTKNNGDETNKPSDAQTNQPKSALELLETVWGKYANDDKFAISGGDEKHMTEDKPGKFELGDGEGIDFELGFPKANIAEIDDAASLVHMMNQNTFTCGVYHVKTAGGAEALASKIKENVLARQWMCGFPEKLVIWTVGDYIISVFGDGELIGTFASNLTKAYGSAKQLLEVPIG